MAEKSGVDINLFRLMRLVSETVNRMPMPADKNFVFVNLVVTHVGYSVLRKRAPGIFYVLQISNGDSKDTKEDTLAEYQKEVENFPFKKSYKNGMEYLVDYFAGFIDKLKEGQTAKIPFAFFGNHVHMFPDPAKFGFEITNPYTGFIQKSPLDELLPNGTKSRYYLGYCATPITFNMNEEDYGADRVMIIQNCFSYPIVVVMVMSGYASVFKKKLVKHLKLTGAKRYWPVQKIFNQERVFVSPEKLQKWDITFAVTTLGEGDFVIGHLGGIQMVVSTGWTMIRTVTSK